MSANERFSYTDLLHLCHDVICAADAEDRPVDLIEGDRQGFWICADHGKIYVYVDRAPLMFSIEYVSDDGDRSPKAYADSISQVARLIRMGLMMG